MIFTCQQRYLKVSLRFIHCSEQRVHAHVTRELHWQWSTLIQCINPIIGNHKRTTLTNMCWKKLLYRLDSSFDFEASEFRLEDEEIAQFEKGEKWENGTNLQGVLVLQDHLFHLSSSYGSLDDVKIYKRGTVHNNKYLLCPFQLKSHRASPAQEGRVVHSMSWVDSTQRICSSHQLPSKYP